MTKVQIICSKPGMRRNGTEHPASAFYDAGHWTDEQLAAFDADPAFVVRLVDETAENVMTDADFQLAVNTEVDRRIKIKVAELETGFKTAVKEEAADQIRAAEERAAEKIALAEKDAADKIATLQAEVTALKKPAPKK